MATAIEAPFGCSTLATSPLFLFVRSIGQMLSPLLPIMLSEPPVMLARVSGHCRGRDKLHTIFAERWPKAENYRDCFELLATSVPRCQPLGYLAPDVGQELSRSIRKLEESGIHRTTSRMLWDMCKGNDGPSQPVARDRIAIREDSPLY
ncbi:hypothetical protein GQ53DRAFT_53706 [Thozetella sp. PMI_491]|nr:hypothetical protein GQ53DRAFT_53706 [Thozetella sp. PMI_491]